MKRFCLILAAAVGLAAQAVPASAALLTYTTTFDCNTTSCSSGQNYGTITMTQQSGGGAIHVVVALDNAGAQNYRFATISDTFALVWNMNGNPNLTITGAQVTGSGRDFDVQDGADNGNHYATPFSKNNNNCQGANQSTCFQYEITDRQGTDQTLAFDIAPASGSLTLSSTLFTTNGANGFYFAAEIAPLNSTHSGDNFYVASDIQPVPEPMTWTMSIAGLLGLAGFAMLDQRRKKVSRLG